MAHHGWFALAPRPETLQDLLSENQIGRIFSAGHLLCDFIQGGEPSLDPAKPALILFKNALAATQTFAHEFQVLGKMLPAVDYQVDESFELSKARAQSYDSDERVDYIYPERAGVRVPAALVTCWRSPEGVPGCLLVNQSERPVHVSLSWSSLNQSWGTSAVSRLTLQTLTGIQNLPAPDSPDAQLGLDLPALQVSLLKAAA